MKISKQLSVYFGCILLSVGLWLFFMLSGVLDGMEQETLRWRYLARGEIDAVAPIVYVDLDVATVSYMGTRPWDRREFARLLASLLKEGQAKVVSVDIILSKFGAGALLDVERARKGDALLGQVVQAYSDQIVLAAAYTGVKDATTKEWTQLPFKRKTFTNGDPAYDPEVNHFPEAPSFPIIRFETGRLGLVNVDEELSSGAVPYFVPGFVELSSARFSFHIMDGARRHNVGFMNEPKVVVEGDKVQLTDEDGWTTMEVPLQSERMLLSLGLETFMAANGLESSDVEIGSDELTIRRGESVFRTIPLVEQQSIEVNWMKGWDTSSEHERYSMQAVIRKGYALAAAKAAGEVAKVAELEEWFQRFEDKVIFVGPVDPQLKDVAPTPFNRDPVPKVGLHANLYRTIEAEAYIQRLGPVAGAWILVLLTLFVAGLAMRGGGLRLLSISLLFGYGAVAFAAFAQFNWILPLVAPVGSAFSAALAVVLTKLGSEEWQRRRIKALFGAYLSPKLVDEMVESGQDPKLGGAEAEITALFSDVEGFSAISEELSPDQLVSLMNEYLGAMTEVFQTQAGTLDKYVGDAIVTMFGMPVPVADHAARACRSAIEMQERHAALREKWAESDKWPESVRHMRTRIGLNTGFAVIGNMGSEMRFNYTMMGDAVNLAARCEAAAKTYGVYTMITESTLRAALTEGATFNYRKLDRIVVKGRRQPVEVYELWEPSVSAKDSATCRELYERGLDFYFNGQWADALAAFQAAMDFEPARAFARTTPSKVLAQRCRRFLDDGAPSEWDGAYRMRSK